MMNPLVRNPKKLKMEKLCYSFEVLFCFPAGELTSTGWRYWPTTEHIEPPRVPFNGHWVPIFKASNTVRHLFSSQLKDLEVGKRVEDGPQPIAKTIKAVPLPNEEPIWEEYNYTREEWYALPDGTVVARESLPERCDHVVVGGKLVKRKIEG